MDNKIISLQIGNDLYNLLKIDAEAEYMNLSAYIRKLLMQKYKEKLIDGQNKEH